MTSMSASPPAGRRIRRAGALLSVSLALGGVTVTMAGCGDTLQDQPVAAGSLEAVIAKSRFPAYWLGVRFSGLAITVVNIDPGGAVTISYGDCLVGGQYTCVTPISIVTSPDNSFLPGGTASSQALVLRGVRARATDGGRRLAIATGGVMVSVFARTPALARAAALTMAPLNKVGKPGAPLNAPAPDNGFDRVPLPSEVPPGAEVPKAAPKLSP